MLSRLKRSRVSAAVLTIACAGALVGAQVPAVAAGTPPIGSRLSAVASSAAGINAVRQFANFATSSDVASAAQFILNTQSPSLTGFQKSLLSLASDLNANSQAIQDQAAGKRLSRPEKLALLRLSVKFSLNPAIQVIHQTGRQLQYSPGLDSTVSGDAAALASPVTVIPPGSGVPQVDSFDNAAGNHATAADLPALAAAVTPIMQDPRFSEFVRHAPPLVAASLIPGDQIWKLLLPQDHDPTVVDWADFIGGVLSLVILGVAAIVGTLALLPAATVAILIALGTGIGVGTLSVHFLATIDCDHDGDPWDSEDVSGKEC